MTRQNITHIASYIMVSMVSLCLLWLTLLDVNTGWCEEMLQLLYVMLAVNAIAFLPVLFIDKINKILLFTQRDGYGIPKAETLEEPDESLFPQ